MIIYVHTSDVKMAVLWVHLEIKAGISIIQRDVQYLHYVIARKMTQQTGAVQESDERITEYIPSLSVNELQNLDRKVGTDAEFMRHSVSFNLI